MTVSYKEGVLKVGVISKTHVDHRRTSESDDITLNVRLLLHKL